MNKNSELLQKNGVGKEVALKKVRWLKWKDRKSREKLLVDKIECGQSHVLAIDRK